MQQQSVRDALHVNEHSLAWRVCSQVVNYTQFAPTVAPIYLNLSATRDILVFSGDVDSCVAYPGTEYDVDQLGYPIKDEWHKWLDNGQIAGCVWRLLARQQGVWSWRDSLGVVAATSRATKLVVPCRS